MTTLRDFRVPNVHVTAAEVTMPAGTYWLGDPCYFVPDEQWGPWLDAAGLSNSREPLIAFIGEHLVLGFSTAYGDGMYYDQTGNGFPVDAGLIGLTPVDLVGSTADRDDGIVVTFDVPTKCSYNEGTLRFGRYTIETD